MKPILEIQNVSKKYRIHHLAGGYLSLRERMVSALKFEKNTTEDFWALKDVSFEVQPGESIGIIGRNGAGKSTLLKVLSKITPPTSGRIVSRGRIASLLEVGTGFHPELTGRENIFFNGSLLGMKRREIESKFDEIVDFSGVERFLDTPLKNYSSGMQLRLAFAVAAFLEPEILIIDEVLAVGDAEFQKKCLRKMEDITGQGRTILFVSHNMDAITTLCRKGVLLKSGIVSGNGLIQDIVRNYYEETNHNTVSYEKEIVKFIEIKQQDERLILTVCFSGTIPIDFPNLGFSICDFYGHPITGTNPLKSEIDFDDFNITSDGKIVVEINSPKLSQGTYQLQIWFGDRRRNFFETKDPILFQVEKMVAEQNRNPKLDGFVIPECKWTIS